MHAVSYHYNSVHCTRNHEQGSLRKEESKEEDNNDIRDPSAPIKEKRIRFLLYQFLQLDYEEAKSLASKALPRVVVCPFIGGPY